MQKMGHKLWYNRDAYHSASTITCTFKLRFTAVWYNIKSVNTTKMQIETPIFRYSMRGLL